MDETGIIVLAKAPRPGLAKTRLIPALGADGAARLAQQLLVHAMKAASAAAPGRVHLYCAPDASDSLLREAAGEVGASLAVQNDGDLGERMAGALAEVLQHLPRALLIGTDSPALDETVLRHAALALQTVDVVLVPALDGGYVLVGVVQARAETLAGLFCNIAWSTGSVMAQTRERLVALGWRWIELAPLADIDEAADLVHLPAGFFTEPRPLA